MQPFVRVCGMLQPGLECQYASGEVDFEEAETLCGSRVNLLIE